MDPSIPVLPVDTDDDAGNDPDPEGSLAVPVFESPPRHRPCPCAQLPKAFLYKLEQRCYDVRLSRGFYRGKWAADSVWIVFSTVRWLSPLKMTVKYLIGGPE